MSNIVSRLASALHRFERYLGADVTAADRQLIRSVRVAITAIEGGDELPRHHVLETIRRFVGELETTTLPAAVAEARTAHAALRDLWGIAFRPTDREVA